MESEESQLLREFMNEAEADDMWVMLHALKDSLEPFKVACAAWEKVYPEDRKLQALGGIVFGALAVFATAELANSDTDLISLNALAGELCKAREPIEEADAIRAVFWMRLQMRCVFRIIRRGQGYQGYAK